jgi:hypothetical protein
MQTITLHWDSSHLFASFMPVIFTCVVGAWLYRWLRGEEIAEGDWIPTAPLFTV